MKAIRWTSVSVLAVLTLACGGSVELKPEVQAQLGEYERLIEVYESRFAVVEARSPQFARVADSYSGDIQIWMSKWDTVAPDLTDAEGRAVQASIDRLNRRAEKMLRGR